MSALTNGTAVYIGRAPNMRSDARIYKLTPPIEFGDSVVQSAEFVVVSAAFVPFSGPETYIFPSKEDGQILSWVELDGSFRGGLDHEEALSGAGYFIADATGSAA